MVQTSKKSTENGRSGTAMWENERGAHSRRMLDVDIPGKRRRGRPNLRWQDACKRDMTEVGLKEDTTTHRTAWRNKIISYTGDPR